MDRLYPIAGNVIRLASRKLIGRQLGAVRQMDNWTGRQVGSQNKGSIRQ